ncbi:hypothetical protein G7046_g6873 [Stylonectria norvegica]|nr:hypothetical protein G7046_g6873 [Stylonectria norvegica]
MAAVQHVQHTRSRSARLTANSTKQSAQHTAPAASTTYSASSLPLFLTNLRLLNLDLHADWPGISPNTFAAGGTTAQGLKKRLQCVEWALFQLFVLWDPDETRSKLKPFFPPLDQVQSLNLRAALLRALELAKKNGVLGRDVLVRKTMLDECRGERLAEVLAAFSSAVLKHVMSKEMSSSGERHPALVLGTALEDKGYNDERAELDSMVLVHKASLHRLLRHKAAANAQFRDFGDLLNVKERGLARRSAATDARGTQAGQNTLSQDAKLEMRRTIRNNWSGGERWMETLFHGDANCNKDGLLGMPFESVWWRVQRSRLAELEEREGELLGQLEDRVRIHKDRLNKWEGFRRRMCEDQPRSSPYKKQRLRTPTKGIDLGLRMHDAFQAGRADAGKEMISSQTQVPSGDYADLVRDIERELVERGPKTSAALDFLQRPKTSNVPAQTRPSSLREGNQETTSVTSDWQDESGIETPPTAAPALSFRARVDQPRRFPVRPKIPYSEGSSISAKTSSSLTKTSYSSRRLRTRAEEDAPKFHASHVASPDINQSHSNVSPPSSMVRAIESKAAPEPASHRLLAAPPTQELADQILESMDLASPSPTKQPKLRQTLSLAERTRLSMVRGNPAFLEHDEPDMPLGPTAAISITTVSEDDGQTPAAGEYGDLVSRTRRSMVGYEKARQKAQLDRRRSLRKSKVPPRRDGSYFPEVAEEAEQEQNVLAEELMTQEDREAVFRSRPKIMASPIPGPTREWEDD